MAKEINILAISYGRNLFDKDNTERKRMEQCAMEVEEYHMIVFTNKSDGFSVTHSKNNLILHPTNSRTRFHMVVDALRIGSRLLFKKSGTWVITSQDPFEAGLVGYILSRKHKIPLNIQEHGDFFSTGHWKRESVLNRLRYIFGKLLLSRADTVRVVSSRQKNTMLRIGVHKENIFSLSVRTALGTSKGQNADTDLRKEYPDASIIILSMARFVPQKNLSLLITAFGKIHQKDNHAKLVLIGSGPEEQKLKKIVTEHGLTSSVVFKPWTDTPQVYMSSADIYTLSSNYEGWGRVLIEAMLSGTPVVTTDVGCAGEVLLDGVHGFVVPVGDVMQFTEKLQVLATDTNLRNRFSSVVKTDIQNTHSTSEDYATAWAEVLTKTIHQTSLRVSV